MLLVFGDFMFVLKVKNFSFDTFFEPFSVSCLSARKTTTLRFKRYEDFLQTKLNIQLFAKVKQLKITGEYYE